MSRLLFIAAACLMLAANPLSAQKPDFDTDEIPKGELAVYVDGGIGTTEWIHVQLDANGVIYNDAGVYHVDATSTHQYKTTYGTDHLYGTDGYMFAPGNQSQLPTWTSWESVFEDDDVAEADDCNGMFGWGEYKLSFTYQDHTEELFINTIDGNWMDDSYGNFNKIVIAVTVVNQGGNYSFTFEQYNWDTDEWDPVSSSSNIDIWGQLGDARNRSTINMLANQQFTWLDALYAPQIVADITVNHNILVQGDVYTRASNSLTFTDDGGLPTYVDCESAANFSVIGRLRSVTSLTTPDYYCVFFEPATLSTTSRRSSWGGIYISSSSQEDVTVDLTRAHISYASNAIYAYRGDNNGNGGVALDNCKIENCRVGLYLKNVRGDVYQTEILGCGDGIELYDKVYNSNGPTLIRECYIHNSTPDGGVQNYGAGIVLKSPNNAHDQSKTPPEQVLITDSRINYNWYDGVFAEYHDWAIYDSEVMHNGYRWGVLRANISPTGWVNGMSGWSSDAVVHGNSIMYNTASGLFSYSGMIKGNTPTDNEGKNCFDGNGYQIEAAQKAHVYLGFRSIDPTGQLKDLGTRNSYLWPKESTPAVAPAHFHVASESRIYAHVDYFLPWAFPCWIQESGAWVDLDYQITDYHQAICAPPQAGGSGQNQKYERDSENASKAQYGMVKPIANDSTWTYTSAAFSEALNEYEVPVVTKAAGYCYYYGEIDAALDTLELYAYRSPVLESGKCFASLYELISVHLRMKNGTEARRAADTLLLRQVALTGTYDSLYYVLTMAELEARINSDTSAAIGLLDSLLTRYPDSWLIHHRLYSLTGDTAYVTSDTSMMKSGERDGYTPLVEDIVVDIFPNPMNGGSIITVTGTKNDYIEAALFDVLGRKVREVYSGTMQNSSMYFNISNEGIVPGNYFIRVRSASGGNVSKSLIVN